MKTDEIHYTKRAGNSGLASCRSVVGWGKQQLPCTAYALGHLHTPVLNTHLPPNRQSTGEGGREGGPSTSAAHTRRKVLVLKHHIAMCPPGPRVVPAQCVPMLHMAVGFSSLREEEPSAYTLVSLKLNPLMLLKSPETVP